MSNYSDDSSCNNFVTHAMVLDTIRDGNFIFKNTNAENNQVKIPVEQGPLEFYFVHLDLTDEAIEQLKPRESEKRILLMLLCLGISLVTLYLWGLPTSWLYVIPLIVMAGFLYVMLLFLYGLRKT